MVELRALGVVGLLAATAGVAAATNTDADAVLRVTLSDGTTVDGPLEWKKTKLYVRDGRRTRKIAYADVASLGLPAGPDLEVEQRVYEQRRARVPEADAKAWARLGTWARGRGLEESATAAFEEALRHDPDLEEARNGLGQLRGESGEWAPARDVLRGRQAALNGGDLDGLTRLAEFALEHDQRGFALDALCEVLRTDTFHADALRLIRPLTSAYTQQTQPLLLPVRGRWRASPDSTRHHQRKAYAVFSLDLFKVDDEGRSWKGKGKQLEDHYAFGAPFYAIAPGRVVEVRDGFPDNAIGQLAGRAEKHNGVSIDHGHGELSWYVHAKKDSIVVKEGDLVEAGQKLGEIGNSGGSSHPHLHVTLIAFRAISVPWACEGYRLIAPDGTRIPVTRAWPSEGWLLETDGE